MPDLDNSLVVQPPESSDRSLRLSARSFRRLSDLIAREIGIQMSPQKISMVQSRLLRRVRELQLGSLEAYCEYLFDGPEHHGERTHFINAITTNKTDFFREPEHFRILTSVILPEWTASRRGGRLLAWSAACSTGEEPYTLAMVLSDYGQEHPPFDFQILATDVSTRVLDIARRAVYPRHLVEPVPAGMRRRYLLQGRDGSADSVRIAAPLRSRVSLHQLNLMDADFAVGDQFHVIFCRNVLIYFDRSTQQSVIAKLCRHLVPGGYLFISHSETLSGLDLPLESVAAACYRRIAG